MLDGVHPFPTHVGVNRAGDEQEAGMFALPHARGGEPASRQTDGLGSSAFPTHVGVNPDQTGDPATEWPPSPRTWG